MKRYWMCLVTAAIAALGTSSAQERAATLGLPAGLSPAPAVIRGQSPDYSPGELKLIQNTVPKDMPKAGVKEDKKDPAILPPATNPMIPMLPGGSAPMILPPGAAPTIVQPQPYMGYPAVPYDVGAPTDPNVIYGVPQPIASTMNMPTQQNWYVGVEGMVWWVKSYGTPALVNVGPTTGIGAVGEPGVKRALPVDSITENPRYGARFTLGYWLSPRWAIEAQGWFLANTNGVGGSVSSEDAPGQIVSRPFFSANQQIEFAQQVSNPGIYQGNVTFSTRSYLGSGEINGRYRWRESCNGHLDILFGARYMLLEENLEINETVEGLAGAGPFAGYRRTVRDAFNTSNDFYGGQIGVDYEYNYGRWVFNARAKLALGITNSSATIDGAQQALAGPVPNLPGGLLALNSNIGDNKQNNLSYIPEVQLNIGYNVTDNIRIYAGYTFIYWSDVLRPGGQIDRTLDENRIPDFTTGRVVPNVEETRPARTLSSEGIWMQGATFGIVFRW
ncbi:MAG: BBP7 family outer membrane beta-barrel protein [Zavarzinella sp.]